MHHTLIVGKIVVGIMFIVGNKIVNCQYCFHSWKNN
jgi:hypothetical protein